MASCNFTPFRSNLQLLLAFFLLVAVSVVLIHHHRANLYSNYKTLELTANFPKNSYDERIVTGFFPTNNRKYNLIDEIDYDALKRMEHFFKNYDSKECTLGEQIENITNIFVFLSVAIIMSVIHRIADYINTNKLAQDHPCVIETIRRHYLNKPSPPEMPLKLASDGNEDRSPGQTGVILRLLKNQVFFLLFCLLLAIFYLSSFIYSILDQRFLCGMRCSGWRVYVEHDRFGTQIQLGRHLDRSQPDHFSEAYFTQSQSVYHAHLSQFRDFSYSSI
jgi:hypothetical protein